MSVGIDWRKLHGSAFEGARAIVTGGAGFIGSHLADALVQLGANVKILDNLATGSADNIPAGTELIEKSILDLDLDSVFAHTRYVFHEGAMASVPLSIERPREFHDVNVTGTLNILQAAVQAGVSRVMFAASSSAYGDSETLPKVETMPSMPMSPYAASKIAGEALMSAWANCYALDTVSLRYFNIFGPRQSAKSAYAAVIAAFADALLHDRQPTIFGDGEQSRDFTYVQNVVHANLLAARNGRPLRGEVINVACGRRITLNQLAHKMADLLGRPHLKPKYAASRTGDVRHSLADLARARQILGYEPIADFDAGLAETVDWYRQTA